MQAAIVMEPMTEADWLAVREIYLEGIWTGYATFQRDAPEWREWDEGHLAVGRIVAKLGGRVIGWTALSAVSRRPVYVGVAEVSVYIAAEARGKGVGLAIMRELVAQSEAANIWTLQAGVFPENVASLRLHEAAGFRRVGVRERLGSIQGRWCDVVLLERRSEVVGVD